MTQHFTRRGVSVLIGALLLVSMTVTVSAVFYAYSAGLLGSLLPPPKKGYERPIVEMIAFSPDGAALVTVRNLGSGESRVVSIYVDGVLKYSNPEGALIQPGQAQTFSLPGVSLTHHHFFVRTLDGGAAGRYGPLLVPLSVFKQMTGTTTMTGTSTITSSSTTSTTTETFTSTYTTTYTSTFTNTEQATMTTTTTGTWTSTNPSTYTTTSQTSTTITTTGYTTSTSTRWRRTVTSTMSSTLTSTSTDSTTLTITTSTLSTGTTTETSIITSTGSSTCTTTFTTTGTTTSSTLNPLMLMFIFLPWSAIQSEISGKLSLHPYSKHERT